MTFSVTFNMPHKKRKYTKRSDYWDQFKQTAEGKAQIAENQQKQFLSSVNFTPELIGESFYSSASRLSDSTDRTFIRKNRSAIRSLSERYANIKAGLLPCSFSEDLVSNGEAIELTQRAYFNVPVVKSTIDIMSEFANSDLYLEGGTEKSRNFTKSWLDKILIEHVKQQFFLEYYRSGNVLFWRIDSKLTADGIKSTIRKFNVSNAATANLPIRYILLNPVEVAAKDSLFFDDTIFVKVLTDYEILKLKNPSTETEKELKNSLPKEIKDVINTKGVSTTSNKVYLELDPKFLHAVFYKKQDYEPLAVPMCFCVLDDINRKMELKKVDQAIVRSVENVILLVTMGAEPDKGGINKNNINAMQDIFRNSSVGRVLVSDYTTKADFVIPDMKKVLGTEKYEVLNTDIREGLQNIMIGDSKYSDAQLKLRVFFQRLDEARDVFLRDFLQPEINRVCNEFGLRNPPKAKFTELDTMDNEALQKLVTRMMELGILTPEQGLDVINTGVFPKSEDLDTAQDKYKQQREEGKFVPIMNTITERQVDMQGEQFEQQLEQDDKHHTEDLKSAEKLAKQQAQQAKQQAKQQATTRSQVKKPKQAGGRPTGKSNASQERLFSVQAITNLIKETNEFYEKGQKLFKESKGLKRVNNEQKDVISEICAKVIVSTEKDQWETVLGEICQDNSKILNLKTLNEIEEISNIHDLDDYSAAILYHSKLK